MTSKNGGKKKGNAGAGDGVGAGGIAAAIAGITAAAVGAYYMYGHKNAEKNRAKVKGWMLRAKGEVLEELEKAGSVSESIYDKAVDTVRAKYSELRDIEPGELEAFISEMKAHWQGIKKSFKVAKKTKK